MENNRPQGTETETQSNSNTFHPENDINPWISGEPTSQDSNDIEEITIGPDEKLPEGNFHLVEKNGPYKTYTRLP